MRTPTILDFTGVKFASSDFQGRSFAPVLGRENPKGWNEIYAAHNFYKITMYYPMRVIRNSRFKLIWNIAQCLEYPFASDLWAASTWQSIYRVKADTYGLRKVKDYLFRPEFELYDLSADPEEIRNLAYDKKHEDTLRRLQAKLKAFQIRTSDPWFIMWEHDSQMQGTGVNLQ